MTTAEQFRAAVAHPNSRDVSIAGVPWPAYKVLALAVGLLTLLGTWVITAEAAGSAELVLGHVSQARDRAERALVLADQAGAPGLGAVARMLRSDAAVVPARRRTVNTTSHPVCPPPAGMTRIGL